MSMRDFSSIHELPKSPAVYALCAGDRVNDFVVYVGISSNLRSRIYQHLIMRDSSAVVESAPVQINVDSISSLKWWQHDDFQSRNRLEGAEIVAFEVLEPTMRSRGGVSASGHIVESNLGYFRWTTENWERKPIQRPFVKSALYGYDLRRWSEYI
jgi:hypothetical protein